MIKRVLVAERSSVAKDVIGLDNDGEPKRLFKK